MKNLKIVKTKEGDNFFKRRLKFYNNIREGDIRIVDLLRITQIKPKSILEIGCANGIQLNQYQEILNTKVNYGIDLSSKAINAGKKKLKLLKLSSLEIDKIKTNFDLIICGFFLYLLDREEIFNQFNLIYNKLNQNGYLIIQDFNPLFKHVNISKHNINLKSFKMNYDNFLVESGLFKMVYKNEKDHPMPHFISKRKNKMNKYKSTEEAISLYKKINFSDSYPENL